MRRPSKHPEEMSAAELARATKQFERPFVFARARPMTATERAQERKLRRGRPKIGKGVKKISISVELDLLRQADAMARRKGINRSKLITDCLLSGMRRKAS